MKKLVVGLLVCFGFVSAFGQKGLHRKAERCFNKFEFASAAHLYEKILVKHSEDELAQSRLEQCYNALNYPEAKTHFAANKEAETFPAKNQSKALAERTKLKLK